MNLPPPQGALKTLFEAAQHYSEHFMREKGQVRPTVFVMSSANEVSLLVNAMPMDSEELKNSWVNTCRLFAVSTNAKACVNLAEAWMATLDEKENPHDIVVADRIDRKEVIVMFGQDRAAHYCVNLPIIRSGNGKFFGLGEDTIKDYSDISGRFTNILPKVEPNEAQQCLAKIALQQSHVQIKPIKPSMRQ